MTTFPSKVRAWLPEPPSEDVFRSVERLARLDDVAAIALMPDTHLAENVCVGVVVATRSFLLPDAVGGDIGCGMAALPLDTHVGTMSRAVAERILVRFAEAIPTGRHRRQREHLDDLSAGNAVTDPLRRTLERSGATQVGTLGSGNHFLELQADEDGRLWLMVHTGSRGFGPSVRAHHTKAAVPLGGGLRGLDAPSAEGQAYLRDHEIALHFADKNRRAILLAAVECLERDIGATADWTSLVSCTHNFVRRERHAGEEFWAHRKGAISARDGEPGIIPGSMGSESYLVSGRGCSEALESSSHGAGRVLSRESARRRITAAQLKKEMAGIWFDIAQSRHLVDEAPSAYKPIAAVMRAQRDLTRVERRLRPILNYKGS